MLLAVIIPVYNEAKLLPRLLERLLETPPPSAPVASSSAEGVEGHLPLQRHIHLIDDGSTDGTRELIQKLAERDDLKNVLRVHLHPRNMGKGAAVATGFTAALAETADVLLIQDADLEYDPRDHARLLAPILDGRADAVIGSRFGGEAHRVLYFWHYAANRAITTLSNILTNLNLSDIECCLKAMTSPVARQISLREQRFGIEPELVAKLARARLQRDGQPPHNARVYEVAVSYAGRTYAEGKKITWRDGIGAAWCIVKYNLF
ncbi:MAG: glycosyltransferase family 2 protein [Phycisphaerales bacterium]